uniref:serine-rich adhesin for platelets-like n=1 Tax=Scatophagus argus TaxID=75038 RepID=UPI001ED819E9|nr:serine-rich adhesin for platelets-like [Scatophagus argus]
MALSQIQCLDDNHVNPRVNESKPEFLYCEDQRLALEVFLQDGREAFFKFLEARGLRGFLSDPELETLAGVVEPYDPGSELFPESVDDDEPPLSLHYWPELSDTSIPQTDLGWPDTEAYRGVTRTTVYSQPPLDGQAHIKEIVRKMIAQAQKVIAVVMDVFTDVDIFRDLLDAGFKRRVSVYILLEHTALPHFLSMCQRANMHAGHLKHLRVRCTGGVEFYTRSSTRVRGQMGHRFMFIDGDKAVSGSYSFTWMSSRLDRNLITVVTGQAVDAFDRLFRVLYMTSKLVDLRQVATEREPEPEPLPQPVSVAPPSAAVARKLYNPKYALALGNSSPSPSPTPSAGHNSPQNAQSQENSGNPDVPDAKKRRRRRGSKEAIQEAPPIHPGLTNLEKAYLISYLPTWPEPDPPSDVIGFINIRDASKPTQVHLQRSEMFEISQAIRFSSPVSIPKEIPPEVAKPRQLTVKYDEMNKLQREQDTTKAKKSVAARAQPTELNAWPDDIKNKAEAPEQNSPASGPKCESDKDTAKTLHMEESPSNQDAGHNSTQPQASSETSTLNTERPSHTVQAIITNIPEPNSLPESNSEKEDSILNAQTAAVYRTHALELNSTSNCYGHPDTNTSQHTHTKTVPPHTDSHTQAVHSQSENSSEIIPNIQTPTVDSCVSPSSTSESESYTFLSENDHISTSMTPSACAPVSSISPPFGSSTTPSTHLATSSKSSSLPPPIPKPRTIQLVVKDDVTSDGQNLPELSVIRRLETNTRLQVVHSEPNEEILVQEESLEKECEIVPELQDDNGSKTRAQKDALNTEIQSETSQEAKDVEVVGLHDDRVETNPENQSDILITETPKAESVTVQNIIPNHVEPETLTSIDCTLPPQIDSAAPVQAGPKVTDRAQTDSHLAEVPNVNSKDVAQRKTYHTSEHELQRIPYYELTPKEVGVLDTMESLKTPPHAVASATCGLHISEDITGDSKHTSDGQQGNPSYTAAHCAESVPNTEKHNTHTFQELIPKAQAGTHTPEKSLHLNLSDTHVPELSSPTPEKELQSLTALVRTPTPEGFLPRTPTPESQTGTPDPRSHTPEFRTPTSDVSDGNVSPTDDSPLSSTSEEYYECSDSPLHDRVFDRAAHRNHGATEDRVSPACINSNTRVATLATTVRSVTQSLSGPAKASSSSSLIKSKVKQEKKATNEENGREVDEKVRKLSVGERRTQRDSRVAQRRSSEETKRTADHFRQGKDTVDKIKETQPQAPKRKRVKQQSGERVTDRGVSPGELTNEGAAPKQLSTGDFKPEKVPSEGERPGKEKAEDGAALGPSSVERKDRPQSTRETEGQKLLHTPPRPSRGQQQDHRPPSPSRPSRSPRLLSGPRPCGSHQLNQPESKALHSSFQVVENTSSPRRLPMRPPPPVAAGAAGIAAGQKQAEASNSQQSQQSQQSLLSRQSPTAQRRAKAGQSPSQPPFPKPQASFLHTHANELLQLHPQTQNQTPPAQEAPCQVEGKGPFSFTLSRLYSLKGLKDKMTKLPANSKRGNTSSPVQGRKSTS